MTPENTFINWVNKRLSSDVYCEKTHNDYRGGTPDVYYEGTSCKSRMFWVEYKFLKTPPKHSFTPKLSQLQKRWLRRNYKNGHYPLVIVGHPDGAYILTHPDEWEQKTQVDDVELYSKFETVRYLQKKANG